MQQNKMANAAKQKRMAHKGWHQECVLENESDFWGLYWFLQWQKKQSTNVDKQKKNGHNEGNNN